MAARQFGFVVARGLAVYCFIGALGYVHTFIYALVTMGDLSLGRTQNQWKYPTVAVIAVYLLLAAFLWTSADRFAAGTSDHQPTLKAGNWVVRLAFTGLGILIILSALSSLSTDLMELRLPWFNEMRAQNIYMSIAVSAVKLVVGVWLFIAYRFDKAAAFEAAQSASTNEV